MTALDLSERTHALRQICGEIYAARQTGLYRVGADGGDRNLYRGWLPGKDLPTLAIAADTATGLLLAGINGGVARSTDGGVNWNVLPFRAPAPLVTCLALLPDTGASVVLAGTFADGVFRSTDSGKTWRATNHGLFDHSVNCLELSPQFDGESAVYAGTESGIYRSENGGRLWRDVPLPAGDETVLSLAHAPDGTLLAGTEGQGLLHSADGGDSWERLFNTEGAVNAVAWTKDRLIAQVDDALLCANDGGATWTTIVKDGVESILIDEAAGQIALAKAGGRIHWVALC